jgi:predicted metalloprotease
MARALLLALLLLTLAGCGDGGDLADRAGEQLRAQRDRFQEQLREQEEKLRSSVDEIRDRIEEVLGQLEQAVPRADRTSPQVQSRGRDDPQTIDAFLTDVLASVDGYWTRTFAANDLPEPRVSYYWVPPGGAVLTGCGAPADDNAAFYCPADDTIYMAQRFAAALYQGALRGLPGESSGGRARGNFGVAYVVAHEYAHNLQQELGIFTIGAGNSAKPFELQADCLAGTWGSSVFRAGEVDRSDIEEAVSTALAVGDFDVSSANHHGTPQERRAAWLTGFDSGDPSSCRRFVPAT